MTEDITQQGVLFNDLFDRPLHVQFDQPDSSSDGGAFLLAAANQALGLTERLALCLRDDHKPGFIFTATSTCCVSESLASAAVMKIAMMLSG